MTAAATKKQELSDNFNVCVSDGCYSWPRDKHLWTGQPPVLSTDCAKERGPDYLSNWFDLGWAPPQ
jgi:hypothetical protein